MIEPTGDDTLVFCRIGALDACAMFVERHAFRPGETIKLMPRLSNGHVFDAGPGRGSENPAERHLPVDDRAAVRVQHPTGHVGGVIRRQNT